VAFRSTASAFAVCSFCQSTLVREGNALRKIGDSAELFDDHSPLQLGASGRYQGAAFTLIGRLQYGYAEGTWNEWHALFESDLRTQKSAWLSEDNGAYVMAFELPLLDDAPPAASQLQASEQITVAQQRWSVASVGSVKLLAAQGELPFKPNLQQSFVVSDLRNTRGEVGTLDYSQADAPRWSIGQTVTLAQLAMTGLADNQGGGLGDGAAAVKSLQARGVACPSCGAALRVQLSTTLSIACHQCRAVVDLTSASQQGVGGDLQCYAQKNGTEPQIPLGSTGHLALGSTTALPWQVVGYVERCEVPEDADDEQVFWREYLLYNRTAGFAFIVDSQDGWSWSAPLTGAPERAGTGAKYRGVIYRKLYDYNGMVTYVLGEFYWRVTKNQRTANSDYQGTGTATKKRLNREQTNNNAQQEVVWSGGETLTADQVIHAFKLAPEHKAAFQRDALPTSLNGAGLLGKVLLWVFIISVVLMLFRCDDEGERENCTATAATYGETSSEHQNCLIRQRSGGSGWRIGGGSFGGFSSGGGHK
jgi:hypothetical protein